MDIRRYTYTYNRTDENWIRAIVLSGTESPIIRSSNAYRLKEGANFRLLNGHAVSVFFGVWNEDLNLSESERSTLSRAVYNLKEIFDMRLRQAHNLGNIRKCTSCRLFYNPKVHTHDAKLCNKCAEVYITCPTCGDAYSKNGHCSNCMVECYFCNELHNRYTEQVTHYYDNNHFIIWVCELCRRTQELMTRCDRCRETFYVWNMADHRQECGKLRIREYSYKPSPVFLKVGNQRIRRYFGIECEAECIGDENDNTARKLSDIFYSDEILSKAVYLKHDGSLNNGIEFVTHPMTRKFFSEVFYASWEKFCRSLVYDFGLRSHDTNTCGLHVHISRVSASVSLWAKLNLFWCTQPFIDKVCRRESNGYAEKKQVPYYSEGDAYWTRPNGRYEAINFTNSKTVEIRQFKGTLNANTMLATILFLDESLHFLRDKTTSYIRNNDLTSEFMSFVTGRSGNDMLVNYLDNVLNRTYNGRRE